MIPFVVPRHRFLLLQFRTLWWLLLLLFLLRLNQHWHYCFNEMVFLRMRHLGQADELQLPTAVSLLLHIVTYLHKPLSSIYQQPRWLWHSGSYSAVSVSSGSLLHSSSSLASNQVNLTCWADDNNRHKPIIMFVCHFICLINLNILRGYSRMAIFRVNGW